MALRLDRRWGLLGGPRVRLVVVISNLPCDGSNLYVSPIIVPWLCLLSVSLPFICANIDFKYSVVNITDDSKSAYLETSDQSWPSTFMIHDWMDCVGYVIQANYVAAVNGNYKPWEVLFYVYATIMCLFSLTLNTNILLCNICFNVIPWHQY